MDYFFQNFIFSFKCDVMGNAGHFSLPNKKLIYTSKDLSSASTLSTDLYKSSLDLRYLIIHLYIISLFLLFIYENLA